jgi:hypothetical protein
MYGCPQAPPTVKYDDLEIPVSYWGQEDKTCPVCGQVILAAAVRCRQCGTTFNSAQPQDKAGFRVRAARESRLPTLRRRVITLLIFALVPFTAPLAALIGAFWYRQNRAEIRALPPLYGALSLIGLGVAVFQTLLFVSVVIVYKAING